MLDKWIGKVSEKFSKKTVENVKQAVIDDVSNNAHEYILLLIGAGLIIGGVAALTRGHPEAAEKTINITYNYYISKA